MPIRKEISRIMGFPIQGRFENSVEALDKIGAVDKKKQLQMILALCEAVEEMENNHATIKDTSV